MRQPYVVMFALCCYLLSCTSPGREREYRKREQQLEAKEQELSLREKAIQLREDELDKLQRQRDTITAVQDSTAQPDITGAWQVRMTCTETTCSGSAVGDTKTEQWNMRYQESHIVAEANVNNTLVRIYSGQVKGGTIELIEHRDSSSLTYDTRMVVRLTLKDKKVLEGQREIIRQNDCKVVYALRMEKL